MNVPLHIYPELAWVVVFDRRPFCDFKSLEDWCVILTNRLAWFLSTLLTIGDGNDSWTVFLLCTNDNHAVRPNRENYKWTCDPLLAFDFEQGRLFMTVYLCAESLTKICKQSLIFDWFTACSLSLAGCDEHLSAVEEGMTLTSAPVSTRKRTPDVLSVMKKRRLLCCWPVGLVAMSRWCSRFPAP